MAIRDMRGTTASSHFWLSAALIIVTLSFRQCVGQTSYTQATTVSSPSTPVAALLQWSKAERFDKGIHSFVAANASGWLVEVHESDQSISTGLYYHLGKMDLINGAVRWGPSRRFSFGGAWPTAAVTAEGYVILTRSDAGYKCCSDLDYYTGTIKLTDDVNQEIRFEQTQVRYDIGFHNGLSVNAAGVIAEVHESSKGDLFYRQGHLKDPRNALFSIEWDTGESGIKYDRGGVDPRVSINDRGEVVEVHGVAGETFLHYTRGLVVNGLISFADEHPRYDDRGYRPSIVLQNNASILETHSSAGILSRAGLLSSSIATAIVWQSSERVVPETLASSFNPSVAVTNNWTIVTYENYDNNLLYTVAKLF